MKKLSTMVVLLSVSATAYPEGSPWLTADATTSLAVSFTSGSTSDFFIGDVSTDLGGDLEGQFVWFDASYGYDDIWAFDARTGYAKSKFEGNPEEESDIADTSVGISYQFLNEFEADNGLPTVSARLGYTFGGDYDSNRIDAIGDGASGFDLSILVGKSINSEIAIFSDLTYRERDDGVPDAIKFLLSGSYSTPITNLGLQLAYAGVRTDSDTDINDPGGISQADKDSDWLIVGANYGFGNGLGIGVSYASLLSATNIPDSDIATFSLGYSF